MFGIGVKYYVGIEYEDEVEGNKWLMMVDEVGGDVGE